MSDDQKYKTVLEPLDEDLEEWEKGLRPVERFEKLVEYGQVGKLFHNSFFKSLDKAGQVTALSDALDHLINQLDKMALVLMKASSTHTEGVKINRMAADLSRAKTKLLEDFAKGIDIVGEISHKAEGERYF